MTRSPLSNTRLKFIATCTVIVCAGLLASGCNHRPQSAIPSWGGSGAGGTGTVSPSSTYTAEQPTYSQPTAVLAPQTGRFTFTQGCTGTYSVRDLRTNRDISNGRAFNSGRGLIALDAQGRQSRAISSSPSHSVIFLPDCNCRFDGATRTSSSLPATQVAAIGVRAPTCAPG
jgi:hypothetical protein